MAKIDRKEYISGFLEAIESFVSRTDNHFELTKFFENRLPELQTIEGMNKRDLVSHLLDKYKNSSQGSAQYELVLSFLEAYETQLKTRRRKGTKQQIEEASKGKITLSPREINKIALVQNRIRGKLYEEFALKLLINLLHKENLESEIRFQVDNVSFEVVLPNGKKVKRRIDIYFPDFRIGVEVKSGRLIHNQSTRNQIAKDKYLLEKKILTEIWWMLFFGASPSVFKALDKAGIYAIDIGLNDYS